MLCVFVVVVVVFKEQVIYKLVFYFYFYLFIYLNTILFIYGCVGSSFLYEGFL